jgi:cytochrome c
MNRISDSILIGMLVMSSPAFASSQLVKEKQCLQCHSISKDTIGPSFKNIAKRWKGKEDAEKTLIATIQKGTADGGGQHWDMKAKMPDTSERPLISDDEAKKIYKWIMSR